VHAGLSRRSYDRLATCFVVEATDIFFDRAVEELDVLWQISDVAAELLHGPAIHRCTV